MTEPITALDGTFLELEDADPAAHMHIGGILVFAPRADGGAPPIDEVRRGLDARLDALPRYRERLSDLHPGGLAWPRWEPDPGFDVAHHVHRAALPAPGGHAELLEWAGRYYGRRLDRQRPLWEVLVLEGLENGRWALVTKTHHCMMDGVGSVDAARLLLDLDPDGATPVPAGPPPAAASARSGPPLPLPAWITGPAGLLRHPRRAGDVLRRAAALVELIVNEELRAAPHTSLNAPLGPDRVLRTFDLPLADAKAVAHALGATVNDVVLAAVTGGLRALLLGRGEPPPAEGVRAMVPVDVRTAHEHGAALGNRISSLFVDLPVAEERPIARLEGVRHATRARKDSAEPLGADALLAASGIAPPIAHQLVARTIYGTRLFNLTVTNVPGVQQPLYAFGSRMVSVWPLVPLAADHQVGIAVISYDGQLCFGVNADLDAVPDVDVLADGIAGELAELEHLARALKAP